MINLTQFRIIGRIGSITTLDKVTHISIASDRRTKMKKANGLPKQAGIQWPYSLTK
jgi:hypothetical protein